LNAEISLAGFHLCEDVVDRVLQLLARHAAGRSCDGDAVGRTHGGSVELLRRLAVTADEHQ
jgi:hypothetical protein